MATFTTDNEDVQARLNALEGFLEVESSFGPVQICDFFQGRYGGIGFRLENDAEFYVLTDAEADTYLTHEVEDYIQSAADVVRLDNAKYLPEADFYKARAAQDEKNYSLVREILLKNLDGAIAQEKIQGRGYMISSWDGKESSYDEFYIYRMA